MTKAIIDMDKGELIREVSGLQSRITELKKQLKQAEDTLHFIKNNAVAVTVDIAPITNYFIAKASKLQEQSNE